MWVLKRIIIYCIWTIIAFLLAFSYMQIILGAKPKSSTDLLKIFDLIYEYAYFHIGSIIGSIIALLYVFIDIFYLQKRLTNKKNSLFIRLLIITVIAIIVGLAHYILEKVVDII